MRGLGSFRTNGLLEAKTGGTNGLPGAAVLMGNGNDGGRGGGGMGCPDIGKEALLRTNGFFFSCGVASVLREKINIFSKVLQLLKNEPKRQTQTKCSQILSKLLDKLGLIGNS